MKDSRRSKIHCNAIDLWDDRVNRSQHCGLCVIIKTAVSVYYLKERSNFRKVFLRLRRLLSTRVKR